MWDALARLHTTPASPPCLPPCLSPPLPPLRAHRLARWVLSQEDPTETFLKQLPRQPGELEVIHPVRGGWGCWCVLVRGGCRWVLVGG